MFARLEIRNRVWKRSIFRRTGMGKSVFKLLNERTDFFLISPMFM